MRKRIGFLAIILVGLLSFSSCAWISSQIRLEREFSQLGIDFGNKDSILRLEQGLNFEYWTKWRPINMLTSKEERKIAKNILKIVDVAERNAKAEKFIQWFWQRRDDNSYDAANEFKDSFYDRVIEAQTRFATDEGMYTRRCAYGRGWETDMGLIYILLGEPYSSETQDIESLLAFFGYNANTAMFPDRIEVWFYDILPNFQGVLFESGVAWMLFERNTGHWRFGEKTFDLFFAYENYSLYYMGASMSFGCYRGEVERYIEAVAESYIYDNDLTFEDFLKK